MATRSHLSGEAGVTLNDRCLASRRAIRSILVDPDYRCPLGKFGRAVSLTHERVELRIENHRLVGGMWKRELAAPRTRALQAKPASTTSAERPRGWGQTKSARGGCSGCGAGRASNDELADLE